MQMTPLLNATPEGWLPCALANLDAVLIDHAHCEKKAASHALTLVNQYPERSALIGPLIALAQEELRHFRAVFRLLQSRDIVLTRDGGDPYVQALMSAARHGRDERLIDRLLIASLVEARSAERLALLGEGLARATDAADLALAPFYQRLAKCEAGHHRLFVRLAKKIAPPAAVMARLIELAAHEAQVLAALPILPQVH